MYIVKGGEESGGNANEEESEPAPSGISNVLKTKPDTAKNSVGYIR